MSVKRLTIILAVAGVLIGLVSLLADVIGLALAYQRIRTERSEMEPNQAA